MSTREARQLRRAAGTDAAAARHRTLKLTDEATLGALAAGTEADPFAVLGPHETPHGLVIRAFLPGAVAVTVVARADDTVLGELDREGDAGLFSGIVANAAPYRFRIAWPGGTQLTEDPYSFAPLLGDLDIHLLREGTHWQLWERLGAAPDVIDGVAGVRFAVWAPNAGRVSVVGDFNSWDGRRHPMRHRVDAGVWEIFIPRLEPGARYNYELLAADGRLLPLKADPMARQTECPPATASVVPTRSLIDWCDGDWMQARAATRMVDAPISIYEVHAGSWLRPGGDATATLDWAGLAEKLIPYVVRMGFTHIELLPIMEYPFGGSWGYQPLSQYAPTARHGTPAGLASFVDCCHENGIGVILDWVPAHFPGDQHGLAAFDGTHLYEHADPREGVQQDWNTLVYNLGRREVCNFLIASALYWLKEFHIDGLRVDAVASMLYRDYSRGPGQWLPNIYGGRENLESVEFLQRLNDAVRESCGGAMTIAEESTAWPGVSAPVSGGGLGFTFKWNMGWMHDCLAYFGKDPLFRAWHHDNVTFGLVYAFSERFILPLSHDEVVYGKGSLYGRAPGDHRQKLANLRAFFTFMWTHPGKKLLFMSGELGQPREWNHDGELDWGLLDDPGHAGLQLLIRDLNAIYVRTAALHEGDCKDWGFSWVIGDAAADSVFAYLRWSAAREPVLVVLNMTPVAHTHYMVGVPCPGFWRERLNSDAGMYGGGNAGNAGGVTAAASPAHGFANSLRLHLPPFGALILQPAASWNQ